MAHVLVVDDDRPTREMMTFLFEAEGHSVTQAEDGQVGLRVIESTLHPMVVIMSCMMPVMNGVEAMERVAANAELAAFHEYVYVTACPYEYCFAKLNTRLPRPAPFIQKPFEPSELLDVVNAAAQRIVARTAEQRPDTASEPQAQEKRRSKDNKRKRAGRKRGTPRERRR